VLVLGLGVGLIGAVFLTRLLQWALWGVTPTDPLTYCAAGLLMAGMTTIACIMPARRALRVAPTIALKSE
jgi:ABC-type antimicrobial peptide transport system permease subunit